MHNTLRNKNIRVFKLIFSTVLFFAISLSLYVFSQYQRITSDQLTRINDSHKQRLAFSSQRLSDVIEEVDDIIKKISTSPQIELFSQTPSSRNRTALENMFYFIVKNENVYSHIRYLDASGIELIRVNNKQNNIERIPASQLEDKSKRAYFQHAQALKQGEIGTWPVDIETENGQLMKPIQTSLRIIMPVYHLNARQGYIVINLSVNNILNAIEEMQSDTFITRFIDENGNLLASDKPSEVLGHLFSTDEQHNLANDFAVLWQQILSSDEGRLTIDSMVYSYTELGLSAVYAPLGKYILISSPTSSAYVTEQKQNLLTKAILLLLLLLGFCSYLFKIYNSHENNQMNQQLMEAAFNGIAGVIITDKRFKLVKTNQVFVRVSGFTANELIGESLAKLNLKFSQTEMVAIQRHLQADNWQGEVMGTNKSGSEYALMVRIQVLRNSFGSVKKYVITFTDITQRKQLEETLRNQSESDPLTGLWNRRKFDDELTKLNIFTKRYSNYQACLGIIDIDFFKKINDQYGHDVGDVALKNLASFLTSQCRETDIIARIGGEEFAILMPHTSLEQAEAVLNRLKQMIANSELMKFTVSGGISKVQDDATLAFKHADIALYTAKAAGRNQIQAFDANSLEHSKKLTVIAPLNLKHANDDVSIKQPVNL
ncbi:diguanylate cyclase [Shewanella sp. 10N.7]|uniref:sensor domain-containing diguanylate cyclase n=1 Tax=Shewanella sp. 10N.7 TaxID=2885093 RepID=UPI001E2BF411|nr:diguanylate cyclase [Shewanella sp. 10N.7]MCC4833619.1 diguanylate cyclase [Shewanella sp. 10N.7]